MYTFFLPLRVLLCLLSSSSLSLLVLSAFCLEMSLPHAEHALIWLWLLLVFIFRISPTLLSPVALRPVSSPPTSVPSTALGSRCLHGVRCRGCSGFRCNRGLVGFKECDSTFKASVFVEAEVFSLLLLGFFGERVEYSSE